MDEKKPPLEGGGFSGLKTKQKNSELLRRSTTVGRESVDWLRWN